jgi:hypothetical protein
MTCTRHLTVFGAHNHAPLAVAHGISVTLSKPTVIRNAS